MRTPVLLRPQAKRDLADHFVFIGLDNVDAAHRFVAAAERTIDPISEMPQMGGVRSFRNPKLAGVRSCCISGFENYLVFYRLAEDGLEVIRVLHGARDIQNLLEMDDEKS